MNAWEELIQRCAHRRREKIGGLSDQAFDELVLAVRENVEGFVDHPSERALLVLARALDAYRASCRNDDLLDDNAYEAERARRLGALHRECALALSIDGESLDARLLEALSADQNPDDLLGALLGIEKGFSSDEPPAGDAWDDVFYRPHLRLRAAVARTCLDTARYRMAESAALSVRTPAPPTPSERATPTCSPARASRMSPDLMPCARVSPDRRAHGRTSRACFCSTSLTAWARRVGRFEATTSSAGAVPMRC